MGRFRRDDGQDLLEYALVLLFVLLPLLLGIMEFGMVVFAYDTIANAAREGARYGIISSQSGDDAGIEAAARRLTTGLDPAALQVTITRPGRTIRVEVTYDHNLISGLIIEAVGGHSTVPLGTVATMQIE